MYYTFKQGVNMANSFMQQNPLLRCDKREVDLEAGVDMRKREAYTVKKMQHLKNVRFRQTTFSDKSLAQWAQRSEEKLAHFKATGNAPESVFDFD